MSSDYWRRCGPCKKEIGYKSDYFHCSQKQCHKHSFCSKDCWSIHNSMMRHKESWPEQGVSPLINLEKNTTSPIKKIIPQTKETAHMELSEENIPMDTLIVASKLKSYIKARSGMNTSANVLERLSEIIRKEADQAIKNAEKDNRKTVMDRDFH